MRDSALKLQDKTILLVGPFNGILQAALRTLTEFGCDVAYVSHQNPNAGRYAEGINEAREVHSHYGRAVYYHLPVTNGAQVQEALGQVTNSLGRVDALVDATPLTWDAKTEANSAVEVCEMLAEKCVPFFLAKQKGRIVYVFEDSALEKIAPATNTVGFRDTLIEKIGKIAKTYAGKNVTVNGLSVGVTDDFLLKNMPKSPSIKKSLEELQKDHPQIKLVDYQEIALGVSYLVSALSASFTGQILRLTHGFHLD
jgi:NAD(P)-dependent dehydrogenase (short-subunit alcohol dehydrogenase family)